MAAPYYTQAASGAVNTLTVTGLPGRAFRLLDLVISVGAQPSWVTSPNVQISDGSTVIWQMDLPPSGSAGFIQRIALPVADANPNTSTADQGLVFGAGNNVVITVASAGGSVKTIINAKVVPQN
jgi:hypothetical protein